MESRAVRVVAGVGLVLSALGVGYAVAAMAGWDPSWVAWPQAVLHLGELAVVISVGMVVLGAGVTSALARVAVGVAVLGQLVLSAAEIVYPVAPDLGDALFGLGPLLSGVGMIGVGIVVVRARSLRWRVLPLLVGIWILVPTTPLLIATGGPPDPLALAAIAVWDVLWAATAATVLASSSSRAPAPAGRAAAA